MANKGNVTVGKPLVAGAVYRAPVGTTLPTAADATLDEAFAPVGYISEEGLRWSYSGDGDVIRAWGRDVVSRPAGVVDDVASFQMLEIVDEEAVRAFWGDDARSVISGGYALQVGVPSPVQYSWVIDMLLPQKNDPAVIWPNPRVRRIVIPMASVRDREEIVYQDSELVSYGLSLKAGKDSAGKYHYEYVMGATAEILRYSQAFDFNYHYVEVNDIVLAKITLGGRYIKGVYAIFKLVNGEWQQAETVGRFNKNGDVSEQEITLDLDGMLGRGEIALHDKIRIEFSVSSSVSNIGTLETPSFEVIE